MGDVLVRVVGWELVFRRFVLFLLSVVSWRMRDALVWI